MSGTAISQLPAAISVINSDLLPVVEVGTPNVTKRLTVGQLLSNTISTAGGVFTGSVEFDSGILLDNNQYIQWRDTSGTPQPVVALDNSNDLILRTHGGATYIENAGGTVVASIDSSGNMNASGSVTAAGSVSGSYVASSGNMNAAGTLTAGAANISGTLNANAVGANSIISYGGINASGTVTASGGVTAGGNGVTYANFTGHAVAFGWNGRINTYVDNNYEGDIAYTSDLNAYLPLGGGHITGSIGVDGPSTFSNNLTCSTTLTTYNLSVTNTVGISGAGTIGGVGWYYSGTGANHGFQLWYNGSAYVRVDGATDILVGSPSDARLKEDIEPSDFDGLAAIQSIQLFRFKWRDGDRAEPVGFVAQELARVFPAAVYDTGNSMGINVNTVLAALVGAVQQLTARLEALENRA